MLKQTSSPLKWFTKVPNFGIKRYPSIQFGATIFHTVSLDVYVAPQPVVRVTHLCWYEPYKII